jgi:zinc/manganese transport system ATP-binding protein
MLAVVGPNGSGKTTLLKGIAGLLQPLEGRIELTGVDRRAIAYLPQQASIDRKVPMSVIELVSLGLWREIGAFGAIPAAGRERLARLPQSGLKASSVAPSAVCPAANSSAACLRAS